MCDKIEVKRNFANTMHAQAEQQEEKQERERQEREWLLRAPTLRMGEARKLS